MTQRYLRGRPFLIINTVFRPGAGVATHVKDWAKQDDAWAMNEQTLVADHISTKMLSGASVIIDVLNGSLVKNRYIENSAEEVVAYYLKKYHAKAKEAVDLWLDKQTRSKAAKALQDRADEALPAD